MIMRLAAFLALLLWCAPTGAELRLQAESGARPSAEIPADLSEQPLVNLLGLLTHRQAEHRRAAYQELRARRDPRAVPGLAELLRFPRYAGYGEVSALLRELTGEELGSNWVAWTEWLTRQESVQLLPQFLEWKAALFRLIDPAFGKFLYPGVRLRIRVEEIVWGGVKKDGIPALTNPKLVEGDEARYLSDDELVFGVKINSDVCAYPLRIMDAHEIVNDVVGGKPVALAYCTLCRSGILFDATVAGKTYTFGSSGLLFRSNKLMYDHQTESLWMTIPGEPVSGPLAHSGIQLKKLPVVVTTWGDWHKNHPGTHVLSLETGYRRDYRPGAIYGAYYASPEPMFPVAQRDKRLPPKEEVYTLMINGEPKAYPLRVLGREPVLNDTLGEENIVLVTNSKTGAVRAYLGAKQTFRAREAATETLESGDGGLWDITEEALVNRRSGEQLPRLAGHAAYWFGWYAFHPRTQVYDGKK